MRRTLRGSILCAATGSTRSSSWYSSSTPTVAIFSSKLCLNSWSGETFGIPHPPTRIYRDNPRVSQILADFSFPVIAKIPRGSSKGRGVFLIRSRKDLQYYLREHTPAYIQEYLPIDRDLRVVLVGAKVVHAYWRIARPGEFRSNVSLGGRISFDDIPDDALQFAERVARLCKFDEVGLDICICEDRYLVIEANMVYGLKGFEAAGLDIYQLLNRRVTEGTI